LIVRDLYEVGERGQMTGKVVVVFGGPTPEHEVSLGSARSVLRQIEALGWDALAVGITKDGRWYVGPGALARVLAHADPSRLPLGVVPGPDDERRPADVFQGPPPGAIFAGYDLALPVCHGRWGEDGTLQGLLACYGLRVVGCGVTASAVCFDKQLAKTVLAGAGIPVTSGTQVRRHAWIADRDAALRGALDRIGAGPWFVKPNQSGSSIGASGAATAAELPAAIEGALRWDDTALVEEYVPHRELLLGVLGHDELTVSPPLEIVQPGEVLDYEEKYRHGKLRFDPLPEAEAGLAEQARRMAAAAYRALGCQVYARVDLFVDTRDGSLLVNEVNTLPGMTDQSAFARLMAGAGLGYPALIENLCQLAEEIR
jgi:D-alanine-D-alanine ligase